jgi:hypothetical protein
LLTGVEQLPQGEDTTPAASLKVIIGPASSPLMRVDAPPPEFLVDAAT